MGISNLLPAQLERPTPDQRAVVGLVGEDADELFGVLASSTARRVIQSLHEEPQAASELAEAHDLSLQNVDYHIQNLLEADLIRVAGTKYSDRGTEMKIYAPTKQALVVIGDRSAVSRLRDHLPQVFAGVFGLAIATVLFRFGVLSLFEQLSVDLPTYTKDDAPAEVADDGPGIAAEPAPEQDIPLDALIEMMPMIFDPGISFALGGLSALLILAIAWFISQRRRG